MVRGSNSIIINTTVELKQLIDYCKQREGQTLLHDSFYMARDYLIRHEQDFIEMWKYYGKAEEEAKELFGKELERWSRTQNELRDLAKKRKKAKETQILEKAREIQLKENKKEIEELLSQRQVRKRSLKFGDKASKERDKEELEKIDKKLSDLGYN